MKIHQTKLTFSLFAIALCIPGIPGIRAQSPLEPPRPAVRNPQKMAAREDLLQTLLKTLAEIRAQRARAAAAALAFDSEKKVLHQEITALAKSVAELEKEKKRLEQEGNELAKKTKSARTSAREITADLKKSRDAVTGAGRVLAALTPKKPNPLIKYAAAPATKIPDLVKMIFRALAIRAGEARSVTAKRRNLPRAGGGYTPVMELRLGGIATLWRTLDGSGAGWLTPDGRRIHLPPAYANLGREMDRAIEIIQRRHAPAITVLPLPPAGKTKGGS